MDAKRYFDSERYFNHLCNSNLFARKHEFEFCTCSGIESLQEPLDLFVTKNAFFCLDDTNDGALFRGRGGGFFKKRTFTIFIMHRYGFRNMKDRSRVLGICRNLFNQIVSKLIVDADDLSNELIYLDTGNILCRELGQYFLNGCTGLYFMIDVSEPVDLSYNPEEWQNKD